MNEEAIKGYFAALACSVDAVIMDVEKIHPNCGDEFCNLCTSIDLLYDTVRVPAQGLELALCEHFGWEYDRLILKNKEPMMSAHSVFKGIRKGM